MRPTSLVVPALLLSVSAAAYADSYSFEIKTAAANSDPAYTFTAAGTIGGPLDPYAAQAYDVNAITGEANGYNFLGVASPGATNSKTTATVDGFTFDNVLFTASGAAHTDADGFLLYLDSPVGTSLAHVFYTGVTAANPLGYEVDVVDPGDPGAYTPFTVTEFDVTPAPVPEPSSLLLLGSGVAGGLATLRRRAHR